jgi:hypothetical protein
VGGEALPENARAFDGSDRSNTGEPAEAESGKASSSAQETANRIGANRVLMEGV